MDIKHLQTALGVTADGIPGVGTYSALFARFGAKPQPARELGIAATRWFAEFAMNEAIVLAHFMAQIAHETGSFRYMEEIASGADYEGRKDLGNVVAGDGKRYKGRGPLQLTGRANYKRYSRKIGIDIEGSPELVARPDIGLLVALHFWRANGLNDLARADDIRSITRRINGGYNGLESREALLRKMKGLLL